MKLSGLSSAEAKKRLKENGSNVLPKKKPTSDIKLFIEQLKSPLIYILFFAAGISFFLKEFSDSIIILLAVVINTILGFYQERKAERSLYALKQFLSVRARVIRDGKRQDIDVHDIVVGDTIVVFAGDKIPADAVVIQNSSLFVNESILTGESVAVHKSMAHFSHKDIRSFHEKDIQKKYRIFMGTTVTAGEGIAIVIKTGVKTEMGRIAQALSITEEEQTPLQKKLASFAQFLTFIVLLGSFLVFITGILVGRQFTEMITTSVAVAVAAIPEGMVVALTVILALGMQRILKRKALVRRLVAAETLGSVTVIATDKTGTLTEGLLRVVKVKTDDKKLAVKVSVFANNLVDPLEVALWNWAQSQGIEPEKMKDQCDVKGRFPFDPNIKLSATQCSNDLYLLGAPEVLLERSTLSKKDKEEIRKIIESWGKEGLRMIGIAYKKISKFKIRNSNLQTLKDVEWVGLVGFEDPIRSSVKKTLDKAKSAGVAIKIITGDYRHTAEAVLRKVGLKLDAKNQIIDGGELEKLSKQQLKKRVKDIVLFARVNPEQKFLIVSALQDNGEIVALLGDGVNDAPAIKRADIGIVVSDATDVAKETADMVLLDSNFETIIAAIEEGRGIFDNIRKVILYLVSSSFSEMTTVFGSLLLGVPLPLTAAQILWINIVTDGFPNLALTVDPKASNLLKRRPFRRDAPLMDVEMKTLVLIVSLLTGLASLIVFLYAQSVTGDLGFSRTIAFTTLAFSSLFYVFVIRTLHRPIWSINIFSNSFLIVAVFLSVSLQLVAVYVPFLQRLLGTQVLPLFWWGIVMGVSFAVIVAIEITKIVFRYTVLRNKEM